MKQLALIIAFLFSSGLFATVTAQEDSNTIQGRVVDRDTDEPLGFVYLHLEELGRTATAHSDGTFEFTDVPDGEYTLAVSRIGYQSISQSVEVQEGEVEEVNITMKSTALSSEAIEVVGQKARSSGSVEHASKVVSGTELRQNLSTTLAGTLDDIPGLSSRSMGTAPSRPIMRGLGGERVLILQDGGRTGDISSQSADHAVTVDPMAAEEIELARGPAALEYGSNAIGGVINVVRNQIPSTQPDHLHGTASIQGKSVNRGSVAAVDAGLPVGKDIGIKFDGNLRSAQNTRTPVGTLENSGILSTNNALGISYSRPWGYAGVASSMYLNNYGIPPDPEGGHEHGVDIEVQKYQAEGKTEISIDPSAINSLEADFSYKNYYHREIEPSGSIGTEYGVLTANGSISAPHDSLLFMDEGKMGIWMEAKNYVVNGTQTPNSNAYSFAGFLIEEKDIGPLHLELGARFDMANIIPEENDPDASIGHIRERNFNALASSATATYSLGEGFFSGATFMHSFRAPTQEELFSEGPHLASYSYEVGNPNLDPERGLGKELFVRYKSSIATAEVAGYHNSFSNYIYPQDTGQPSSRFPTLNEYQFTGVEALFQGVEVSSQVQLWNHWALSGSLSYTQAKGKIEDRWQPLPMIPPLKGSAGITYESGGFQLGSKVRLAASQTRTGEFETSTDGYTVVNLFGGYRFQAGGMLHTFTLNAENILNTTYRSHLSRIKEQVPEPGRNIALLYRLYF